MMSKANEFLLSINQNFINVNYEKFKILFVVICLVLRNVFLFYKITLSEILSLPIIVLIQKIYLKLMHLLITRFSTVKVFIII